MNKDLRTIEEVKWLQTRALKDTYPNNADLGEKIRMIVNNYEKTKSWEKDHRL